MALLSRFADLYSLYSDPDPAFLKDVDPDLDPEVKNATFLYLSLNCKLF